MIPEILAMAKESHFTHRLTCLFAINVRGVTPYCIAGPCSCAASLPDATTHTEPSNRFPLSSN